MISGSSLASIYPERWLAEGFFARHETFCPRYGWLKKGFDEVSSNKEPNRDVFDGPDDIERLGVGKNMVRSIRFWCVAFHLIEPDVETGPRRLGGPMRVTPFGNELLADDGWDPFLEDPASLWLLHWQLFSSPISATAWSLAINLGHVGSFTLKELDHALKERKNSYPALARYSDSSIEKDASCFIRMYAPPDTRRISEEIECPFTDLGLLAPSDEKQAFRFNMADKSTLPEEIFLAACCDYAIKTQSSKALSLNKVSYDFNAPGVVFKLSESDVGYRLEEASQKFGEDVRFVELYGQRQIQFERDPQEVYWRVLHHYYGGNAGAGRDQ